MIFSGRAHKVGAHIDTDAIIPARFLVSTDPLELGKNCMEGLEPGWIQRIDEGDILVAGENFGCGSSREHAPLAILGAGIKVVVAHSFARIFYRNGFNMGLTLVEIGPEVEKIADGDRLQVDAANGAVIDETAGVEIAAKPVPPFMRDILDKGGLVEYVKARLAA
ncbi:3-isopropylmalate dehydratase small subunit [Desulfohalovibrio reitneri]|uniref:3-isopropylmalate dehydratase small subunit n=1 Tax=Desulfohalovibrio reitneri TaxID=1307759 RepID=UPI0004A7533A|nr:3-isopropylmalate dehydratase small subunit [Desulfohalovibrio reitneri]